MADASKMSISRRRRITWVVGVKLRAECRDMLTWIVAKLAQPGDHVIAIHVTRPAADPDSKLDTRVKKDLDATFQDVLGVYQGICTVKQVRLDIKVVRGPSLRKALIEACRIEAADKLILGTDKHHSIRLSESLAKYCAKHLPSYCSTVVIDQNKIVFDKSGTWNCSGSPIPKSCKKKQGQSKEKSGLPQYKCYLQDPCSPSYVSTCNEDGKGSHGNDNVGWPLLRQSTSFEKAAKSSKLPVIRWILELPDMLKDTIKDSPSNRHVAHPKGRLQVSSSLLSRFYQGYVVPPSPGIMKGVCQNIQLENNNTVANGCLPMSEAPSETDKKHVGLSRTKFTRKLRLLCQKNNCTCFKYEDLEKATCKFSLENLVGTGGCSKVYRGTLNDGKVVAVKCLNEGAGTNEELLTEVEILSTLSHPNVVNLLGYCVDGGRQILVYSLSSNGNLEENLYGKDLKPVLPWEARFRIAVDAAKALCYLHDSCPRPIIHRDVKSSNILLSADFHAQISDFGLAKWAPSNSSHITCPDVVGTLGYLAPEYFMFGKINEKTDVYSFGVVLLELVTGRQPIDVSKPKGQENLVAWSRPLLEAENMGELIDPQLKGQYNDTEMKNMTVAAAACLRQSSQFRPRISRVLKLLVGEEQNGLQWAATKFGESFNESYLDENGESDIRRHLALAMVGVDDDLASISTGHNSIDFTDTDQSMEEYLGGRFSRSSSLE